MRLIQIVPFFILKGEAAAVFINQSFDFVWRQYVATFEYAERGEDVDELHGSKFVFHVLQLPATQKHTAHLYTKSDIKALHFDYTLVIARLRAGGCILNLVETIFRVN